MLPLDDLTTLVVRYLYGDLGHAFAEFAISGIGAARIERDESGQEFVASAVRTPAGVHSEPVVRLDNRWSQWRLLDSVTDPIVDQLDHLYPWQAVLLPVGRLRVATVYLEGDSNGGVVHEFKREGPVSTARA